MAGRASEHTYTNIFNIFTKDKEVSKRIHLINIMWIYTQEYMQQESKAKTIKDRHYRLWFLF